MTDTELDVLKRVTLAIRNLNAIQSRGDAPDEECVLALGALFVVGGELEAIVRQRIAEGN